MSTDEVKVVETAGVQDESANESRQAIAGPGAETLSDGARSAVVNAEAVVADKATVHNNDALPSFFIGRDDKIKVDIDIMTLKSNGKVVAVSRKGLGIDFKELAHLCHSEEWFEFSVPSYDDVASYRQRSTSADRDAQVLLLNRIQLRNFLLVWHLKDWSLRDKSGKKVALRHDENGTLSSESLGHVYALHPTIVDVVMTSFEKDMMLS